MSLLDSRCNIKLLCSRIFFTVYAVYTEVFYDKIERRVKNEGVIDDDSRHNKKYRTG